MSLRTQVIGALGGIVALAAVTTAAQADPMFTTGSATIVASTNQTDDILTNKSWALNLDFLDNGVGSLSGIGVINLGTPTIDFANAASFDWSVTGIGTFTATNIIIEGEVGGNNASITYAVVGTFLIGSDYSNSGSTISASETWTLNQTGGPGKAVDIGGTFNAPALIPEPGSLALLGTALLGLGGWRARRKTKASA